MVTSLSCLSHWKEWGVGCTLVGTWSFPMSFVEATLVQLSPSMMSSHTLPPIVHWVWKISSLCLCSRGTSLAWRTLRIINNSPTCGVTKVSSLFILFLILLLLLNSLDFLYLYHRECSSIGTIHLEVSIIMAFEIPFPSSLLEGSLAIPFPLSKALIRVGVGSTLLCEEKPLRCFIVDEVRELGRVFYSLVISQSW